MSEMRSEGILQKIKGKIQETWGNITDDDYDRAMGNKDQLVGTIKEKTGETEEDIRRKLDEFDRDAKN